jgi:hypothetical protein
MNFKSECGARKIINYCEFMRVADDTNVCKYLCYAIKFYERKLLDSEETGTPLTGIRMYFVRCLQDMTL